MKNRKAKFLFVKPGQRIRLTNRLIVRYAPSGTTFLPTHFYGLDRKPSAAQNRWKNHSRTHVKIWQESGEVMYTVTSDKL